MAFQHIGWLNTCSDQENHYLLKQPGMSSSFAVTFLKTTFMDGHRSRHQDPQHVRLCRHSRKLTDYLIGSSHSNFPYCPQNVLYSFFFFLSSVFSQGLHVAVGCHNSLASFSLDQSPIHCVLFCFVFHDIDIFEDHRPAVFQYVPQSGFAWLFPHD